MGTPYDMGGNTLVVDSIELGNTGAGTAGTNPGIYAGAGAPTITAAKGSIYLRTDGSAQEETLYVNTDGADTWVAGVAAAA